MMRTQAMTCGAARGILIAALLVLSTGAHAGAAERMSRYNVVWTNASADASGVMPFGNGDIAAGVYAVENGDLFLLLAKNDAYTYMGDVFKTGRVRISLSPNPFASGKAFRQTLDLATGSVVMEADGVALRIWADASRPLYHVEISAPDEIAVTARPEFWKRFDRCSFNRGDYASCRAAADGREPPQDVQLEKKDKIIWYYSVGDRSIYRDDLADYRVEHMASRFPDPFRFNTFGNLLEMEADGTVQDAAGGVLAGKGKRFDIRIHALTLQTPEPSRWVERIERQAAGRVDVKSDWAKHCRWWSDFWDRSWIVASDNTLPSGDREQLRGEPDSSGRRTEADGAALTAQSYNVFRFLMACQSRGRVQTKFNGGLFTQQLLLKNGKGREHAARLASGAWLTHEDDRLWGRRFTFQNQRLLYWPLLASGDFDLMQPFFNYYSDLLEMRTAIAKAWSGHEGAYYRENIEPTGGERESCTGPRILPPKTKVGEEYKGWYHDYYFTSGLEITAMMLDYVNFTGDTAFRDRVLVPFARQILLFFDRHYPRVDGKLRLDPAQVLETWWIAVNPAPDVAGLRFCLNELLALKAGTEEDQARWETFRSEIPEVFLQTVDRRKAIAPAQKWEKKSNAENGELYPVFPFRCFGLALGSADIVEWTMRNRSCKDALGCACWMQDQIHWACAGKAAEAAEGLIRRFRVASPMCRFPLYGKEGPDSCPDFDHFGSGSVALQRMLVQEGSGKIYLLPAWPSDWDVDFKLHVARGGVISGTVKEGKLLDWDIQPSKLKKDVVVCQPQSGDSAEPAVPSNEHPLRAGSDANGRNCFRGKIGRMTLFRGRLAANRISELASGDRSKRLTGETVAGSWLNPGAGDKLETRPEDFSGAVSFEAWIQPGENESGRIIDKLTPGTGDGFLLDAWPKLGLRLIVGSRTCRFPNVLKPGVWQHVAVVISHGTQYVYLDGRRQ